ncbi:hypothetical protein [Agromyces sp. NPDC058104]|uniref:hypothetical protein n=1 Tax=Agromyces sp. NPDC058104 TaxID=3346342 RepID=UPI0036DA70B8
MNRALARGLGAALLVSTLTFALSACSPAGGGSSEASGSSEQPVAASEAPSGQSEALDGYVAAVQEQMPALLQQFDGMYSAISAEAVAPDTIDYRYTFTEAVDPATAVPTFEQMKPSLQQVCDDTLFPEMESYGITAPKVTYTYLNPDGSEVWANTFASE